MAHYKEESKDNMMMNNKGFKYLMKKMTQILLPLSLFSFIFSHSSLSPLLLQSYDYLLNFNFNFDFDLKFKLFTYTTERNCIFLLCNGILVFIIQSSGLISKITPVDSAPKISKIEETKIKGVEKVEILEQKSSENVAAEVEEGLQDHEVEKWVEEEEEKDDDDEDDGGIDTEELKKKCEEFIKKVKLEIQGA